MISILAAIAVMSQSADEAGAAYRACADIDGRRARLRCYDAAAQNDPVLLAAAAAEQEATRLAEVEAAAARQAAEEAEAEAAAIAATASDEGAEDSLAAVQARLAEAEQRAREAEAALAAVEARAEDLERRAGPERVAFDDRIAGLGLRNDRTLIVRLADGSVWRQNRGDDEIRESDFSRIRRAYVKPGPFGGWRMTLEPLGKTIQVRPRDTDRRANQDD